MCVYLCAGKGTRFNILCMYVDKKMFSWLFSTRREEEEKQKLVEECHQLEKRKEQLSKEVEGMHLHKSTF